MISIKGISKTYITGDVELKALDDVTLSFREKEFVSILGQSGCGKTTLLNIIGGLDRYDRGDICVNDISTKNFTDSDWDNYRNHYIGFVFQSYNLIPHLSVIENVELALSIGGVDKNEKRARAEDALREVGLLEQAKKRPNQLSGGQMQRVAIARAIVNNPEIILADEPTGALDSETSVQVMNILKKISKKHLVIMVTHNTELAGKYSTRIIRLHDGRVISDSKPVKNVKRIKARDAKRSFMSPLTAFALSFKNLMTKKAKSFLISFAGSIGIIGIALVLAVSNGFSGYINRLQSDTLGDYPITVSAISIDIDKFATYGEDDEEENNEDYVLPYDRMQEYAKYGHYNNFAAGFMDEVKKFEAKDIENGNKLLNQVEYNYFVPVKLITKKDDDSYSLVKRKNAIGLLSGDSVSEIYPIMNNPDYVWSQYEVVAGALPEHKFNEGYTEAVLVVENGNKISYEILQELGFDVTENDSKTAYNEIDLNKVIGKEYRIIFNNDYYTPDSENFAEITNFTKLNPQEQSELEAAYNGAEYTLKISGIVKQKDDATSSLLSPGLVYLNDLEQFYAEDCEDSIIAKKYRERKENEEYNKQFYDAYELSVSFLEVTVPFTSTAVVNAFLSKYLGTTLPDDQIYEIAMQQVGISTVPVNIKFYTKSFDAKASVVSMIDKYNAKVTDKSQTIKYTDTSMLITNTLGSLINIISIVLIAFAGISLVVSSIMIGIITYASVIERTKEIGVLRSIGARKKDISRIFNFETFLIGFAAGVIGVLIAGLISLPISLIVGSATGGSVTGIASLRVDHAIILIAISTILTLFAGFIPSKKAASQDPVKALRSE